MQSIPVTTASESISTAVKARSLSEFLEVVRRKLVSELIVKSELQVEMLDRGDSVGWYAFDPKTKQQFLTDSEDEMRVWIEQHYQKQ